MVNKTKENPASLIKVKHKDNKKAIYKERIKKICYSKLYKERKNENQLIERDYHWKVRQLKEAN